MAGDVQVKITGLDEVIAALKGLPDKLRKRILRNALAAGARIVRDEARASAPVLRNPVKARYRTPGTVRNAIVVRTSKVARRAGDVGVYVNVRPAKRGQRGAKSKTDPFYWRWLEFGTVKLQAFAFLQKSARRLPDALQKFIKTAGPAIQKLNNGK